MQSASIWPSSSSDYFPAVESVQGTMSESFSIYGVTSGTVSNSTYVLYMLTSSYTSAINKVNPDNSLSWTTKIDGIWPLKNSIAVDLSEQNVYIANLGGMTVVKIKTVDGSFVFAVTM